MQTLAGIAHEARAALQREDRDAFAQALDAGYDIRASIFELDLRHVALVEQARAHGLSATYTGSGGAIVGIASDADAVNALARRLEASGARLVEARPGPPHDVAQPPAHARSSGSGSIG